MEEVRGLAGRIASAGPLAVRGCKRAIDVGLELPIEEALRLEFGSTIRWLIPRMRKKGCRRSSRSENRCLGKIAGILGHRTCRTTAGEVL